MLYYIETGCEFTSTYGGRWEQFHLTMETHFDKAMSLIATIKPNKRFHNRIEKMLRSAEDCGWDFSDTLRAIYDSYR